MTQAERLESTADRAGARSLDKAPPISEKELMPLGKGHAGRRRNLPELVIHGYGRLLLNVAAVSLLSPKKPFRAILLYVAEKNSERYLVIRPASENDSDAIRVQPTGGGYVNRWPAVLTGRANIALRKAGLVERSRFAGIHDRKRNWLVFDLNRPIARRVVESPSFLMEAVDLWLKSAERRRTIAISDAFEEMRKSWVRAGRNGTAPNLPFPFERPIQLAAYIRRHANRFARMGLKLGGAETKPPIILE